MTQTLILALLTVGIRAQVFQRQYRKLTISTLGWLPSNNITYSRTQSECSLECLKHGDTCFAFTYTEGICEFGTVLTGIKLPNDMNPSSIAEVWSVAGLVKYVPHILIQTGTTVLEDISLDPSVSNPIIFPNLNQSVTPVFGYLDNQYNFKFYEPSLSNDNNFFWTLPFGQSNITSTVFNVPQQLNPYGSFAWIGKRLWAVVSTDCNMLNSAFSGSYLSFTIENTLKDCRLRCQQTSGCNNYTYYYGYGGCYFKSTLGSLWGYGLDAYTGAQYCNSVLTGVFQDGQYTEGPQLPIGSFPNMLLNPTVASADDDTGLIFFGSTLSVVYGGTQTATSTEAWKYNFLTDQWTRLSTSTITRYGARAERVVLSDGTNVLVLMGDTKLSNYDGATWIYRIAEDTWVKTGHLLPGYMNPYTSTVVKNRLFLIGTPASSGNTVVFEWTEVNGWTLYSTLRSRYTTLVTTVYNNI